MCQAYSTCFNQYILPFVIVFGILATFLVTAVIIVLVHKCRKAKALKDAKALKRKMRENKINNTTTNIHAEEQKINDGENDEGEEQRE